jgi:hypothetical protein
VDLSQQLVPYDAVNRNKVSIRQLTTGCAIQNYVDIRLYFIRLFIEIYN